MYSVSRKYKRYAILLYICMLFFITKYISSTLFPCTTIIPALPAILRRQPLFNDEGQLRCLLMAQEVFRELGVPWFITFGSALFYHRDKTFNTDDIDTGIFYENLLPVADRIQSTFLAHQFVSVSAYGSLHDGQEWTFMCPSANIKLDVFVFYDPLGTDPVSPSFAWWSASYNGACNRKRYRKYRWQFSPFTLETVTLRNTSFSIVPVKFLVEQYGENWMTPIDYNYFDSIGCLPNLIDE